MRRATMTSRCGRGRPPSGPPASRRLWFVHMSPTLNTGEYRVRLERPAEWICVAEASELITCSVQTIHNLCEEGTLEWRWVGYKGPGGKKLVLVDSIQRYVAGQREIRS